MWLRTESGAALLEFLAAWRSAISARVRSAQEVQGQPAPPARGAPPLGGWHFIF